MISLQVHYLNFQNFKNLKHLFLKSNVFFFKLRVSSFSEVAQLAPPRPEVRRAGAQGVPRVVVVAQS